MEPEIIDDGINYHINIPKDFSNEENIYLFLKNIKKNISGDSEALSLPELKIHKEELKKRWPSHEPAIKKMRREMKVLVVDNHASIRAILQNILIELDFYPSNIEYAKDGKPAINKIKTRKYDLIFSDCYMPQISGLDLFKTVKDVPGYQNTQFIMVADESTREYASEAINFGINGFITVPFNICQVEKTMKTIFNK